MDCPVSLRVMFSLLFDDDLHLFKGVKNFSVQQLVAEACVEACTILVHPRCTWFDGCGFGANGNYSVANDFGDEPRTVV